MESNLLMQEAFYMNKEKMQKERTKYLKFLFTDGCNVMSHPANEERGIQEINHTKKE